MWNRYWCSSIKAESEIETERKTETATEKEREKFKHYSALVYLFRIPFVVQSVFTFVIGINLWSSFFIQFHWIGSNATGSWTEYSIEEKIDGFSLWNLKFALTNAILCAHIIVWALWWSYRLLLNIWENSLCDIVFYDSIEMALRMEKSRNLLYWSRKLFCYRFCWICIAHIFSLNWGFSSFEYERAFI